MMKPTVCPPGGDVQRSLVVHGLPSLHGASGVGVKTQPVSGAQESVVQGLLSSHVTGGPPAQTPFELHVSEAVQASPSLHGAPTSDGWRHSPVDESQESSVQGLASSQLSGSPELQPPKPSQ